MASWTGMVPAAVEPQRDLIHVNPLLNAEIHRCDAVTSTAKAAHLVPETEAFSSPSPFYA